MKTGRWIDMGDDYVCSVCGHEVNNPKKQPCGAGQCERCGASMEDGADKDKYVPGKPRLAEVLGVDVGQKWRVVCPEEDIDSVEVWLNEKGHLIGETLVAGSVILCAAINHPESIVRAPRLTEPEIAIMRAVGARWVSKNQVGFIVDLWDCKPVVEEGVFVGPGDVQPVAIVDDGLFPSVGRRKCVEVGEA